MSGTGELKPYLKRTYQLVRSFWQSEHRKTAWGLLSAVLAIEVLITYFLAKMSYAYADLFNAMDARNVNAIWLYLGLYAGLFSANLFLRIFNVHFRNLLIIHWRRYMTKIFLTDYLHANLYNQLELKDYDSDNPDQRISQDLFNLANETLELGVDFLMNLGRVVVFSVILWRVSGALAFQVAGIDIVIPGYMFWFALIYCAVMTWTGHRLAHPMSRLNFERQAAEADFRHRLARLRENAESVALLQGGNREASDLRQKFTAIRDNWMELLKYKRRLFTVQMVQIDLSMVLPYVAAMPAFMLGTVALGGFMQISLAFNQAESAMSWFLNVYERLAVWKSSVDRVAKLQDALQDAGVEREQCQIKWQTTPKSEFKIDGLRVELPSGHCLIDDIRLSLRQGKDVVVTGPSGSGKSTFFKALSGLWVWGKGEIKRPGDDVMFIPQKPYLPVDTLRNALSYPNPPCAVNDARLQEIMRICLLGKFVGKLDESCDWARVLSGGEQQRLVFVRAILAQPNWLFLDEATAALDPLAEASVYMALKSELPHTTVVSIAHRESLKQYHDLHLSIDPATRSMSLTAVQPA